MRQSITIRNVARGTSKTLLLDRQTCRLSNRQKRETFQALSVPGFEPAGDLGEWPLVQVPPECPGTPYHVVKQGAVVGSMSEYYFLPVETAVPAEAGAETAASAAA